MKQERKCGSCRWFHNMVRTWCLRYPPVPVDNRNSRYPAVTWDQTCGEWTQAEENIPENTL